MQEEVAYQMTGDAQGEAILRAYENRFGFEVFERDDGFVSIAFGPQQYLAQYPEWIGHEKEAIEYARGRCLDVGCGAGRVALHLQDKGIGVVSIDSSPLAIKVCRLRGVRDARLASLEDFIKNGRPGAFDTVIMFGNNFGVLENLEKGKRLLKELHKTTKENGLIIAESRDPYINDDPVHAGYYKRNIEGGKLPGQIRMRIRFLQYSTGWFDYILAAKGEMEGILSGTGWRVIKYIDDPDFSNNGEYIAVIGKC